MLLLNVAPHALGIETVGGVMTTVISRNTIMPIKKTIAFSTMQDNQTEVLIRVFEGEQLMTRNNLSLGKFWLDSIPPTPRGTVEIEVTFDLDASARLQITAVDKSSGTFVQRVCDPVITDEGAQRTRRSEGSLVVLENVEPSIENIPAQVQPLPKQEKSSDGGDKPVPNPVKTKSSLDEYVNAKSGFMQSQPLAPPSPTKTEPRCPLQ